MNFSDVFVNFNLFSILIPLIIGFFTKKYHYTVERTVWLFVILNFSFTVTSYLPLKLWFGLQNNTFILLIAAFSNTILKYFVYKGLWQKQILLKTLMYISLGAMVLSLTLLGYNFKTMSSFLIIEGAFTVLVSSIYLTSLHKTFQGDSLRKEPIFWISIGFIFNGIFNIMLYSFMSALLEYSQDFARVIWTFFVPLTETLVNLLIAFGFYLSYKNQAEN